MDLIVAALTEIIGAIGPGGLLVLLVAALWLHLDDCISDLREARQQRAAGPRHVRRHLTHH